MRILLVEDEDKIASFVEKGLSAEGHTVERAATAEEALGFVMSHEYDLVLLDLMLPDADGRTVLARIREHHVDVPVIVVSALDDVDDKVDLLDAGANDYLTKPFAFAELTARVRANVRQNQASSRVLEVGSLQLDTASRIATSGDISVDLRIV